MTTVTAHAAAATANTQTVAPANPNGQLGQNDFLKLMVAQLQAQNPLEPGNTNEYLNQVEQMTQVEQLTNMASANELSSAVGLIGHTVNYSATGGGGTGKVESVQADSTGTTVTVEGTPGIALTAITEVK
jgi:flagellar basal-body rod modification protein FlgD